MEECLDHPIFKDGVVNGDELRWALPLEIEIFAHLRFRLRTLVISCDQLRSAWDYLGSRAIDVQLNCNDIRQARYHVSMCHTDYLGYP